MRISAYHILILLLYGFNPRKAQSMDSLAGTIENIPGNFLSKIEKKYASIEESLSKKYKISKKLKGNMQLLYDFLARDHVRVSQLVLFYSD